MFLGMFSTIFAQQEAQYTQYMYNTLSINPAYAGSRGIGSFFGLHRSQWVGLDGAPKTSVLSFNTPIQTKNLGIGASIYHETIGPVTQSSIIGDISYTVNFENSKLAFGLKATIGIFSIDYNKLHIRDREDFIFLGNDKNIFSPNIGPGLYWYSKKYYFGLSVPNLLQTDVFNRKERTISVVRNTQHIHVMGGYVFNFGKNMKFKPAVLSKIVQGAPLELDVSANFMFNDKFVIGAAWRWSAAVSGMVGFQMNKRWFIGYAYDMETTELAEYNYGSHEIFLRYELFKDIEKIISPRFF